MGLRDEILSARDLAHETVAVSEWGGDFVVTELTALDEGEMGAEHLAMTKEVGDAKASVNYQSRVLVRALRDPETWELIFDPHDPADAIALGGKSATVLGRLYDIASRLSGMDVAEAGGEDEAGNSDAGLSDDSPTA